MAYPDFSFILNNRFILRHCIANDGNETPDIFHCNRGLRRWSRFFYLDKGTVLFFGRYGDKIRMEAGDIMYLPYDIEYSSSWEEKLDGHYFTAEFIIEDIKGNRIDFCDDIALLPNDGDDYRRYFSDMAETVHNGTMGFHMKCQEQFLHLLHIIAMRSAAVYRGDMQITHAITELENNFRKELNVNKLAALCHMSPASFRRHFLAYAGMSPVHYRNHLRLQKARELISTGIYTVSEAAELVGISDIFYFSKMYKREFGNSPSKDIPKV